MNQYEKKCEVFRKETALPFVSICPAPRNEISNVPHFRFYISLKSRLWISNKTSLNDVFVDLRQVIIGCRTRDNPFSDPMMTIYASRSLDALNIIKYMLCDFKPA